MALPMFAPALSPRPPPNFLPVPYVTGQMKAIKHFHVVLFIMLYKVTWEARWPHG